MVFNFCQELLQQTTWQPRFHCIIGNLWMKSQLYICKAEINSTIKAVYYVVRACVVMTALSMCWMAHSVFALWESYVVHMLCMPVLELLDHFWLSNSNKCHFTPKWLLTRFQCCNVFLSSSHKDISVICLSPTMSESTSVMKCLLLGSMWICDWKHLLWFDQKCNHFQTCIDQPKH